MRGLGISIQGTHINAINKILAWIDSYVFMSYKGDPSVSPPLSGILIIKFMIEGALSVPISCQF